MKALLIVGASIVLLSLIQIGAWAQEKYTTKAGEEFCGTWVNKAMIPPKIN